MKELLELFFSFMSVGVMTFGGGYAMLPMLSREIVEKRQWVSQEEMMDYFSIGQCTPGIIAVNTATFIGYRRRGVLGAAVATIGVVLPSVVIIVLIAAFLDNFMEIVWIQHAFAGVRIAVCALIASTVLKLIKNSANTWLKICIAALAFICVAIIGVSPIYVTIAFAVFGAFFYGRGKKA
ncbi:MAG: chromate transporter [Eubacteriales bacterium]|nr:chromate transporter [Eubacteriales bacterium]